ncbi:MAG: DUF4465 domain-containing protein [Pirellulales bacterium]
MRKSLPMGLVSFCALALGLGSASFAWASKVDFEDVGAGLAAEGFWNGSDGSGQFASGGAIFKNNYNADWASWDGFAYSNQTDTTDPSWMNQYSAITGGGANGSATYAVGYHSSFAAAPELVLPAGRSARTMMLTNTTRAYLSMATGDGFAKKFGGAEGTDPDWFLLTISGTDAQDKPAGTVDFYLADFRFENSADDYLLNTWRTADLSSLAGATKLRFSLASSDVGKFGINTPTYFALDDLTLSVRGDVNLDETVDIFDVAQLQTKYGTAAGATWADGDFDGNGTVDIFDVAVMQVNYGNGMGGAAMAPVPAPSSSVLALLGLTIAGAWLRRKRG